MGTITLVWTAALPENAQHLVFTDHYEPGGRTAVQTSVLVAPEPIALGPISHTDADRSISVVLNPTGTTGSNDPAATAPDATPSASTTAHDASPVGIRTIMRARCRSFTELVAKAQSES